jgi:hypothetical protein
VIDLRRWKIVANIETRKLGGGALVAHGTASRGRVSVWGVGGGEIGAGVAADLALRTLGVTYHDIATAPSAMTDLFRGYGVRAYRADGTPAFTALRNDVIRAVATTSATAYVSTERTTVVLDPVTGATIRTITPARSLIEVVEVRR